MSRRLLIAIVSLTILMALLIRASSGAMPNPFLDYENLGIWVAAALTLFALSFLYGDNPFYRLTEHVFVGVSAAYWMVTGFWSTIVPKLLANLAPEIPVHLFRMDYATDVPWSRRLLYLVPLLLGLLLLARLHPRGRRLGALPLAFVLGVTAGLKLLGNLDAGFMAQIRNSIVPLAVVTEHGLQLGRTVDAALLIGGVLAALGYFYFGRKDTGAMGATARAGLWVLMVTFGASFGFTVMGRIALLVGRMEFLLRDWLGLI